MISTKFNRPVAIGFIIGFFVLPEIIYTVLNPNLYSLFRMSVGFGLAIAVGFVFNRGDKKNGWKRIKKTRWNKINA